MDQRANQESEMLKSKVEKLSDPLSPSWRWIGKGGSQRAKPHCWYWRQSLVDSKNDLATFEIILAELRKSIRIEVWQFSGLRKPSDRFLTPRIGIMTQARHLAVHDIGFVIWQVTFSVSWSRKFCLNKKKLKFNRLSFFLMLHIKLKTFRFIINRRGSAPPSSLPFAKNQELHRNLSNDWVVNFPK